MRSLVALTLGCALAACGGSSDKTDAAGAQDLSAVSTDLATPQSCAQVYACTSGCSTPACTGQCGAGGSTAAQTQFAALYACAYAQCLSDGGTDVDGGTSCSSASDDTASCNDCLHAAELAPACSSQLAACEGS